MANPFSPKQAKANPFSRKRAVVTPVGKANPFGKKNKRRPQPASSDSSRVRRSGKPNPLLDIEVIPTWPVSITPSEREELFELWGEVQRLLDRNKQWLAQGKRRKVIDELAKSKNLMKKKKLQSKLEKLNDEHLAMQLVVQEAKEAWLERRRMLHNRSKGV